MKECLIIKSLICHSGGFVSLQAMKLSPWFVPLSGPPSLLMSQQGNFFFLLWGVGAKLNLGKCDLNLAFVKNITLTRESIAHIHCKHRKWRIISIYCCKSTECHSQTKHCFVLFFLLIGIRQQLENCFFFLSFNLTQDNSGQRPTQIAFISLSVQSWRGKMLNIYISAHITFISSSLKCWMNIEFTCWVLSECNSQTWLSATDAQNFPATQQLLLMLFVSTSLEMGSRGLNTARRENNMQRLKVLRIIQCRMELKFSTINPQWTRKPGPCVKVKLRGARPP